MTVKSEKETAEGGSLFYFCKPGLEDRDGDQMPQRRSAPLSDDNKRPPMMTVMSERRPPRAKESHLGTTFVECSGAWVGQQNL